MSWLVVLAASLATAQTQKPILRIEAGMHTAPLKRIDVDRAERYLVSASLDKTVRIWELSTGRLLRILRPPIGDGDEGKMYSVAISPDGNTIACGGFTGPNGGDTPVYVFDRETGRMLHILKGFTHSADHLAFSKDGKFLAAGFGGTGGIRIFRTADYTLAGEDSDYKGDVYGIEFSPTNPLRVVSTAYDGFVRLYSVNADGSLRLLVKREVTGGKRPFGIQFSPDGARIAVGFDDSLKVTILSASGLTDQYFPDVSGLSRELYTVAWSQDGEYLYAGGSYGSPDTPIVRWANGGRGARRDLPAANNTLLRMLTLRNGDIVFAATDPALGRVAPTGRKVWFQDAPIADYRNLLSGLRVSQRGDRVGFSYGADRGPFAWFSVEDRILRTVKSAAEEPGAVPVIEGLPVTNWRNNETAKLNGKALPTARYETSRSVAIAPDRRSFVLGTDWNVHRYDDAGKSLWTVASPDVAWSVNITGDGQLVVAAMGDGTIRWYRLDNGKELLAFFPDPDHKRWVLWTPSGYYDASPGAEDLIGWQLNRGAGESADFFPASRFRSTYYRPDVVARILGTRDEATALKQADDEAGRRRPTESISRMLPPLVTLLSPADGSDFSANSVKVRFSLRNPSGEPVTGVRALVDGRPVSTARSIVPLVGETREIDVPVPGQDCSISLIAENRFTSSEPATVRLHWRSTQSFVIQPKLYILSIGIGAYRAPYQLSFPAKDARDFVSAMLPQKGRFYREVETRLIVDGAATAEAIRDGLEWLERSTTQHDVAMVFLSGHGDNDQRSGIYYFMPVNFDPNRLKATAIAQSDILSTVQTLQGKALFFIDTCHSGNVLGGRARSLPSDLNALVNELSAAENGAVVFAASSGRQVAIERDEWANGAFTKAVIEGVSGKAAIGGARITVNMLDLYISERVKQLTGGQQTPTTTKPKTINDFPIAVR